MLTITSTTEDGEVAEFGYEESPFYNRSRINYGRYSARRKQRNNHQRPVYGVEITGNSKHILYTQQKGVYCKFILYIAANPSFIHAT